MSGPPITDELAALVLAKKATLPEAMAADVLAELGDGADWSPTLRALQDLRAEALADPADTKTVERMLLAQSVVLQSLFAHYMTRANRSAELAKLQAFGDLALKAQNQCRRTLATLAEIRNPRRTQFIKQLNQAVNQQVNNDKSLAAAESRKIPESEPPELLTVIPSETLDTGRAATPISGRASLEAVGAQHGPQDARRESPQQQERVEAWDARRTR